MSPTLLYISECLRFKINTPKYEGFSSRIGWNQGGITPLATISSKTIGNLLDKWVLMDWVRLMKDRTVEVERRCDGYSRSTYGKGEPGRLSSLTPKNVIYFALKVIWHERRSLQ
jgi:hypothetical protein